MGAMRIIGTRTMVMAMQRYKTNYNSFGNIVRFSSKLTVPPMRDYSSSKQNGNNLLMAIGTAAAAGGLAFCYLTKNKEKFQESFTAYCAEKDEQKCVEKKCGDSACLRKMDKEEEMISKANTELEKALKDVKPKATEYTESALKAFCDASVAVKQYMDKAYCALEEDGVGSPRFEEMWCDVYDVLGNRCEKVKDALSKAQCAWELLCRLREVIANGKACRYTQCNPLLITAEETLQCAERELTNAKNKMDCVQGDSRLVEQYSSLIQDFRTDLKGEVDSSVGGGSDCAPPVENEASMIITQAYKKVLRAQKELAQTQACAGQVPERLRATLC